MTRTWLPVLSRRPLRLPRQAWPLSSMTYSIIAQIVDVQQAIHRHIQDLHEAAELDHGGDEALEGLADALLQIGALEEARHVAVGLVGALLQARGALAERARAGCFS